MKKNKYIFLVLLVFIFAVTACNKNDKEIFDCDIAVVETTSNKEKSLITYYDNKLNAVGTKSLNYAELGSNFYRPVHYNEQVYIVPRGLQGRHDEKKIISLNIKNGEDKEISVNKNNIICTAVNGDYIFAGSNLDAVSYLTRTNFNDGNEKEIAFNNEYLSLLTASDQYVFVFLSSIDFENMYSKMNIYDTKTLELKISLDISDYGINQTKYYLNENKLYFTNSFDKNDHPTNMLGIVDLVDFSLKRVELEFNSPDDIEFIDNKWLVISCTDVVQSNGTNIILYEIDTGEQVYYDLKIPILNIKVLDDKLIVLGSDNSLNVYDINNDMKHLRSIKHKLSEGVYCSTLFVNE